MSYSVLLPTQHLDQELSFTWKLTASFYPPKKKSFLDKIGPRTEQAAMYHSESSSPTMFNDSLNAHLSGH